jgi:hypothetical protein
MPTRTHHEKIEKAILNLKDPQHFLRVVKAKGKTEVFSDRFLKAKLNNAMHMLNSTACGDPFKEFARKEHIAHTGKHKNDKNVA